MCVCVCVCVWTQDTTQDKHIILSIFIIVTPFSSILLFLLLLLLIPVSGERWMEAGKESSIFQGEAEKSGRSFLSFHLAPHVRLQSWEKLTQTCWSLVARDAKTFWRTVYLMVTGADLLPACQPPALLFFASINLLTYIVSLLGLLRTSWGRVSQCFHSFYLLATSTRLIFFFLLLYHL